MKTFYITTAIDYANGQPHLGHAYEKVLTDVIVRFRKMQGDPVYFLTGLDEHGQKVQQTAETAGVEPLTFCNEMAEKFKELCQKLLISNNDYIRTTQKRHQEAVHALFLTLYEKGDIYKGIYKGYYSTRAEQFLQEKDKVDGNWPDIYGNVTEIEEPNYFFKLSQYQGWLLDYIQNHEEFIFPRFYQKQVLQFLKQPINDLCVSRPKERLSWGIPLPFDKDFVNYVWFDALINYLSGVGYPNPQFKEYWPVDYHVIGKDILLPAHAIYWPIMLYAAGIPLPKTLLVHGWWLQSGEKMSKSKGNSINPLDFIDQFGPDAFRYFLIREINTGQDSNFSTDLFMTHYQSDLGNDLGNLLSRLLNMGERYSDRKVPASTVKEDPEETLKNLWEKTAKELISLCETFQFHMALKEIFSFVQALNRYTEIRAPWNLSKSKEPLDRERLWTTLATMAEGLRLVAVGLTPFMPTCSAKILESLGLAEVSSWGNELAWSSSLEGNELGEKIILFPRK